MFAKTWREHWGLVQDPFDCEDADKDPILVRVDEATVHTGFDRLFGSPLAPAPGVIFGEKGSGKSGLRVMMRRRIDSHNRRQPDEKVFLVEYTDFDQFLDQFRRATVGIKSSISAEKTLSQWSIADHLDAILCNGVSRLVEQILDREGPTGSLSRKQKVDLELLTALYHDSRSLTTMEAQRRVGRAVGYRSARRGMLTFLRLAVSVLGLALVAVPFLALDESLPVAVPPAAWYGTGGALLALTWGWTLFGYMRLRGMVRRTVKSLRVLRRDQDPLFDVLEGLPPGARREFGLPREQDDADRYDLLHRFIGLLEAFGFRSCYVLMDRVDEPSFIGADAKAMRVFVERILDHKFLQFPGMAIKLFLPIELDGIHRNAVPEDLKRMRLDKSNLVPELRWSGLELHEIANRRIGVCLADEDAQFDLGQFFDEGVPIAHVRETLQRLGTPRMAFNFLSTLFQDYIRELPDDLDEGAGQWRIPRSHFDLVSAGWMERANLLRRTLN